MAASNMAAPTTDADDSITNSRRPSNMPKKRSITAQSRSRSPSSIIIIAEASRLQLAATNVVNHYFGVVRQLRSRLWETDVMMLRSNSSDLTIDDFVGFAVTSQRKSPSSKRQSNERAKNHHRAMKESILNCIVDVEGRIDDLRKELENKLTQLCQRGIKKARWQNAKAADFASFEAGAFPTLPMKTSWPRLTIVHDSSRHEIGVVEAPWEFHDSLSADAVFGRFFDVDDDEVDTSEAAEVSSKEGDKRVHKSRSVPSSVGGSFLATVDEEGVGDWEDSVLKVESLSTTSRWNDVLEERQQALSFKGTGDEHGSADTTPRRDVHRAAADTPSSTPRRYMLQTRSGQKSRGVASHVASHDSTMSVGSHGLRSLSPSPVANTSRRHNNNNNNESQLPSVISMNSEWEDDRGGDALMDRVGDSVWAEANARFKEVENDSFFNVIANDNNNNNQRRSRSRHSHSPYRQRSKVSPCAVASAPALLADSTVLSEASEEFDSDETTTTIMSSMCENDAETDPETTRDRDTKAHDMASGDPSAHIYSTPASRSNAKVDPTIQFLGTPPSWQPEAVDLSVKAKVPKAPDPEESRSLNVVEADKGVANSEAASAAACSAGSKKLVQTSSSTLVTSTTQNTVRAKSSERKLATSEDERRVNSVDEEEAAIVASAAEDAYDEPSPVDSGVESAPNAPILPSSELVDDLPGLICFSPFQMSFILTRGTKCVTFRALMQKSADNENFVFQNIDPFASEGQEKVLEMILGLDPSVVQDQERIKSALTSNLACLATLRSKADYHAKLIGGNYNARPSAPTSPASGEYQPTAEADRSALSASRDTHDSGMASFDQSHSYLPSGQPPPQPQPLPIITPFPIPPSAYTPWVSYSSFQTRSAPTFQTLAPTFQTPAPIFQTPAPTYQTPAPTYHTPAPTYQTPAPTYRTPAPTYHLPTPTPPFYSSTPFVRPPLISMQQPSAPPMVNPAPLHGVPLQASVLLAPSSKGPSSTGSGSLSPILPRSPRSSFRLSNAPVTLRNKTTKDDTYLKTSPVILHEKRTRDDCYLKTSPVILPPRNLETATKPPRKNPLHVAISNVIGRTMPPPGISLSTSLADGNGLSRLASSLPKLEFTPSTVAPDNSTTAQCFINVNCSTTAKSIYSTTANSIYSTSSSSSSPPPFFPSVATISANQKPSPLASTIIAAQSQAFAAASKTNGLALSPRASGIDRHYEINESSIHANNPSAENLAVDTLTDVAGPLGESFGVPISAAFKKEPSRTNSRFPYSPAASSASDITAASAYTANAFKIETSKTCNRDFTTLPESSKCSNQSESFPTTDSESNFTSKPNYAMMPLPEIPESFEMPFRDSLESLSTSDFASPQCVTLSSTSNTTSTESKPLVSYPLSPLKLPVSSDIDMPRMHSSRKSNPFDRTTQENGDNEADVETKNKVSTSSGPPGFAQRPAYVPSLCDDIETPFHDDGSEQPIPLSIRDICDTTVIRPEESLEIPNAYLHWVSTIEESNEGSHYLSPNRNVASFSAISPQRLDHFIPGRNHPESGVDTLIITAKSFFTDQSEEVASGRPSASSPSIAPSPDSVDSAMSSMASGYRNTPTPEDGPEMPSGRMTTLKSKDIMSQISAAQRVASKPPLLPTPMSRYDGPALEPKPLFSKAASKPARATLAPSSAASDDDEDLSGNRSVGVEWETVSRKKRRSAPEESAATPEAILSDDDKIIAASQQVIPTLSTFDSARILEGIRRRNYGDLQGYTLAAILKIYKEKCFKTALCYYYAQNKQCSFGSACTYAHGYDELKGPGKPSSVSLQRAAAEPAPKPAKSCEPTRKPSPMKLVEVRPKGQLMNRAEKSSSSESASSGRLEDEDFYQGIAYSRGCDLSEDEAANDSWETVSTKKKRSFDVHESGAGELDDEAVLGSARRIFKKLSDFDATRILDGIKRKNGGNLVGCTMPALMKVYKDKCFKTSLCLYYTKGECREGSECTYAHGKAELRGSGRPSSATIAAAMAEQAGNGS